MLIFDKFRQLNRFMQKTSSEPVDFDDIAAVLSNLLECNAYVISRSGKILGYKLMDSVFCDLISSEDGVKISRECNEKLWEINEPTVKENINCIFFDEECPMKYLVIVPTYGAGTRMGTLVLGRIEKTFDEEDRALGEYGATIVGLGTMRSKNEKVKTAIRKQAEARGVLSTLSYSEMEAVNALFEDFKSDEKIIVVREMADKIGISSSVFVNALAKLESAGVLVSRSLGMKGTHIKILNDLFLDELKNM